MSAAQRRAIWPAANLTTALHLPPCPCRRPGHLCDPSHISIFESLTASTCAFRSTWLRLSHLRPVNLANPPRCWWLHFPVPIRAGILISGRMGVVVISMCRSPCRHVGKSIVRHARAAHRFRLLQKLLCIALHFGLSHSDLWLNLAILLDLFTVSWLSGHFVCSPRRSIQRLSERDFLLHTLAGLAQIERWKSSTGIIHESTKQRSWQRWVISERISLIHNSREG